MTYSLGAFIVYSIASHLKSTAASHKSLQGAAACTRALCGRVAAAVPSLQHLQRRRPQPSLARTPCPHSAAQPVHPVMLLLSTCPCCPLPASPPSAPTQHSLKLQVVLSHTPRTLACAEASSGRALWQGTLMHCWSRRMLHSLLQAKSTLAAGAHGRTRLCICIHHCLVSLGAGSNASPGQ